MTNELNGMQEFHLAILNSANLSIISTDPAGTILTINKAACRWLGYGPEELLGSTPAIFHDPAEMVAAAEKLTKVFGRPIQPGFDVFITPAASGQIDDREWTYIRKDGSHFPVSLSITVIRDENERIVGYLGIATDLTANKELAELIERNVAEERLQSIVDNAVDGIITIDKEGKIESLNTAAVRLFGYNPEEVIGRNVKLMMPSPYHDEHDGYLRHYLTTGIKKIIGIGREVVGQRKDGSRFPMDLAVSETSLGDRRIFTGVVRDISERKAAESKATLHVQEMQESEGRLRAVLESVIDGIITIDERGEIASLNPAAVRLFGYAPTEVIGKNVKLLMPAP